MTPHPSVTNLLRWFASDHLSPPHRPIVEELREVAEANAARSSGPELAAGLRKLLEAKDCFVRASIASGSPMPTGPSTSTRIAKLAERLEELEEELVR